MVCLGIEDAGVPGSSPGVAIEDDERKNTALRSPRGAVFAFETSE